MRWLCSHNPTACRAVGTSGTTGNYDRFSSAVLLLVRNSLARYYTGNALNWRTTGGPGRSVIRINIESERAGECSSAMGHAHLLADIHYNGQIACRFVVAEGIVIQLITVIPGLCPHAHAEIPRCRIVAAGVHQLRAIAMPLLVAKVDYRFAVCAGEQDAPHSDDCWAI